MTWSGHSPVRGKISVKGNVSVRCSAPIGAGGFFDVNSFYQASAPIGAGVFALESQIDQLVYQLYDITPDEQKIIEAN